VGPWITEILENPFSARQSRTACAAASYQLLWHLLYLWSTGWYSLWFRVHANMWLKITNPLLLTFSTQGSHC